MTEFFYLEFISYCYDMAMEKDFWGWMYIKEKLDTNEYRPPLVSERDIWWASVGENVGSEIGGKSDLFSRPVLILRKLAHGFYFVIPTTTKDKEGSWYVPFVHKDKAMVACLHQARAIDYRRLSSRLGQMEIGDYEKVLRGFTDLYIKNIPRLGKRGRG